MKSKLLLIFTVSAIILSIFAIRGIRIQSGSESGSAGIEGAKLWTYLRLRDPKTGIIPNDIHNRELRFASTLPGSYANIQKNGKSTMLSMSWNSRGPVNIGGRTRVLAKDIRDANIVIAAGVSGGIWRSTDDGTTWIKMTRPDQVQSATCIVQDIRKGHEDTWYCGSGEIFGNSEAISGDGIYKSNDNGQSWSLIPSTATNKPNSWENPFDYIWNVAINPANSNADEVFAATAMGAVMRSTDGGKTWKTVLGGSDNRRGYANDVIVTPKGIMYAVLGQYSVGGQSSVSKGIYRSTNGTNWTEITYDNFPAVYNRCVIAYAPTDENQLYFLAETPGYGKLTFDVYGDSIYHSLWKYTYVSGDGKGANGIWENRSMSLPKPVEIRGQFNSQHGYDLVIKVKPNNANVVFIGGTNIYRSDDAFKTPDNTSWIGGYLSGVVGGYKEYPNSHPDIHALFFDYNNPNVLYSGTDGGVAKTLDCSAGSVQWISLNNKYLTTQFYSVAINHYDPYDISVIGGMQDNCTYRTNSLSIKDSWTRLLDSDGFCSAVGGKNIYYASKNRVYQPKVGIYRIKTDDAGNVLASTRIDPVGGANFIWNTPYTLDPNNSNKMYVAGGQVIWVNSDLSMIPFVDSKDSTSIGWDSLTVTHVINDKITAVRVSKEPANILYYGTQNGKVYKVTDCDKSTRSMHEITGVNFPAGYVSCITPDPANADRVLVSFSNYNILSIFLTEDGGANWTPVSGNLEEFPSGSGSGPAVNWIEILPVKGRNFYLAGTSTGLYCTANLDGMSTVWNQEGTSEIGNVVVDMIDVRAADGYVAVGTHGSGVFSANITSVYLPPNIPNLVSPVTNTRGVLNNVLLKWTPVSSAVYYDVQIATDSNFTQIVNEQNGITTTEYNFTPVGQGLANYYWRVFAKNAGGAGQPSEVWSFRSAVSPPELTYPGNSALNIPLGSVAAWNPSQGATSYHFMIASNLSFSKLLADTVLTATNLLMNGLEKDKKYYWKVSSKDADGEGLFSQTYSFRTETSQGIADGDNIKVSVAVSVSPNPVRNKLTIDFVMQDAYFIKAYICDVRGAVVRHVCEAVLPEGKNSFSMDVASLWPGTYFLVYKIGNFSDIRKIVVL